MPSIFEDMFKNMAEGISPIALFKAGQEGKLARELGEFRSKASISTAWESMKGHYSGGGPGAGNMFKDYFAGHDLGMAGAWDKLSGTDRNVYNARQATNSIYRKVAAAAIGGATVGSVLFGSDSFPAQTSSFAIKTALGTAAIGGAFHWANRMEKAGTGNPFMARTAGLGMLGYGAYRTLF